MCLDRGVADRESLSDLGVGAAMSDEGAFLTVVG